MLTMAAACTDNSGPHLSSSFSKFIRCCRSSTPYTKNVKNCSKICPQDEIWSQIRQEAESDMKQDPLLSDLYRCAILSHSSLEGALSNYLALKLRTDYVSSDALAAAFHKALLEDAEIGRAVREDLAAVRERDPACLSYVHCFLNFKGFLACQAYRLAHKFWIDGRTAAALLIQSRVSEVFAVDIHPGAEIGSGLVIDHATGVVVGETAVIGDGVTILHNVTLGGTGKAGGDRHPKIGDGVLIGAGAKVLGNIVVRRNARIGAGAVVLKEVPEGATAVGNPARIVGSR
ncbi:serine acetyltransferase 1, chloroplastic-like [Salvia miltiorrhiza]|uniref:serine acetyltransferase 1, chloroplastic-like n=1 Tax=Salvia miltiorrhiza TaxID=226208 RepID=UPI0025AB99BF|nr:serine acetyltransferase 1, chloroplastic-like [Salvia miltiorrhiza]